MRVKLLDLDGQEEVSTAMHLVIQTVFQFMAGNPNGSDCVTA
jgi:hypothetical protein